MERLRKISQQTFEAIITRGYDMEVVNKNNLDVLNTRPECPVVISFNHITADDPLFIFHLVYSVAPQRLDNAIVPVSERHTKFKNFPAYSALVTLARDVWGVEMPEVVQSYRLRNDIKTDNEEMELSSKLGKNLFRLLKDKIPTGSVIMISPEGHRSETGTLQPAESGAGGIAMMIEKIRQRGEIEEGYYIPIATVVKDYKGNGICYNPFNKPEVICTVGEPLTFREVVSLGEKIKPGKADNKTLSHIMMARIAGLLPEDMQGVYHPGSLQDTLEGRFELRTGLDGVVYVHDIWGKETITKS